MNKGKSFDNDRYSWFFQNYESNMDLFLYCCFIFKWEFQVFAGNLSGPANNDSQTINLVLPENGGKFENELSDYTERRDYGVVNLTNGFTKGVGWSSKPQPDQENPQEFVYSFEDGKPALLDNVVIHGVKAKKENFPQKRLRF